MKKLFLLLALPMFALSLQAKEEAKNEDCKRVKPNYALAERFSPNKISRMVKSTSVTPRWFQDGKRFWYSFTYSDGTRYYIVDEKGNKKEKWSMEKLAAEMGCEYIDVNAGMTDENGDLKVEYAIEGMHMWATAYVQVFRNMLPYLEKA